MKDHEYLRELNQDPKQQQLLSLISQSRGYENNDILNAYRAIFIQSHDDMIDKLGHLPIKKMLYMPNGHTFVPGKLFIPGFSPLGHLVTFVSYDPIARKSAQETGNYNVPYYFYPDESTGFRKTNFILMPYESWGEAIKTRKIGLADGVFDAGAVSVAGIPCGAALGSSLGPGVKKILSLFDIVTQFKDNDSAGTKLFLELAKFHPNVDLVKVPHQVAKDIDDYITEVGIEAFLSAIGANGRIDLVNSKFSVAK